MNTRFSTLDIVEDDELIKSVANDLLNQNDKPLADLLEKADEHNTGRTEDDSKSGGESQK